MTIREIVWDLFHRPAMDRLEREAEAARARISRTRATAQKCAEDDPLTQAFRRLVEAPSAGDQ